MDIHSAELLAAVSYMMDVFPGGCSYHSWRVGLVGQRLAAILAPEIQRDVFYAGMLQDIGTAGAYKQISIFMSVEDQLRDPSIRNHCEGGTALIRWLPGMEEVATFVKSHHEWWDGSGYPGRISGDQIPLGGQILRLADTADMVNCYSSASALKAGLSTIAGFTGRTWSSEIWSAMVTSTEDALFYKRLMNPDALPALVQETIANLGVPDKLNNAEGVERIFYLFPVIIDDRDPSTSGHSLRVAKMANTVAVEMGLSKKDVHTAYYAGLVHDSGRLGVDPSILNKLGRLSAKELEIVRKHAKMTVQIMSCLPDRPEMTALGHIAGHDHEHWDGSGYPDGLVGEKIPLISRILGAVDAFDAMISTRSYRMLSPRGALVRLQQGAGKQFDPKVIEAMTSAYNRDLLCEKTDCVA